MDKIIYTCSADHIGFIFPKRKWWDVLKRSREARLEAVETFSEERVGILMRILENEDLAYYIQVPSAYREEIQREFKVNLAGPTTLTAILNSLQMGFKTLAIQKKSSDVFKLLGAVKTEFNKFADTLQKAQKKVDDASNELDSLVGTRTRMIQSKLRNIEYLDEEESKELLEIN